VYPWSLSSSNKAQVSAGIDGFARMRGPEFVEVPRRILRGGEPLDGRPILDADESVQIVLLRDFDAKRGQGFRPSGMVQRLAVYENTIKIKENGTKFHVSTPSLAHLVSKEILGIQRWLPWGSGLETAVNP
jgi:hypothetical protein